MNAPPANGNRDIASRRRRLAWPILAFASAAMLWAAFPPADLGWLVWFVLVPWLVMLCRSPSRAAWIWSFAAGSAFFAASLHWLRYVNAVGWFALAFYCALYWPLAAWLIRLMRRRALPFFLCAPLALVPLEFLRARFLTGFPFFFLGHTQHSFIGVIQIADITGVYGISFLIALTNGALADAILSRRTVARIAGIVVAAACILLSLGYGAARLKQLDPAPGPELLLVQGNIPQSLKHAPDENAPLKMLAAYAALSEQGADEKCDMVIWPETMFPAAPNIIYDKELMNAIASSPDPEAPKTARFLNACRDTLNGLLTRAGCRFLVGAEGVDVENGRRFNSAFFLAPGPQIIGRYDKIHLVIFGEYTPLAHVFPFLKKLRPAVMGEDLTAGRWRCLFDLPYDGKETRFGVTICYEDADADLFRKFVRDGARLMVNITNDGWFRDSSELDAHFALCVFRAVEGRVTVARCANTGITGIIGPDGRVLRKLTDATGKAREIKGALRGNAPVSNLASFYAARGDIFAWLCSAALAVLLAVSALRHGRNTVANAARSA